MRALFIFALICSCAVVAGCVVGSRYVGDWQRVNGGQNLTIVHVRGVEFTVTLAGIGEPRSRPGFLLSNGSLEVGGVDDIYFQYLVSDKDNGHLYLLQATDMRVINSQVKGGKVSASLVNGLQYVEFARVK